MITFRDGPAKGQVLQLKRAPRLLRVVCSAGGEWDALDQLGDTPPADESITVYQLNPATVSRYHLLCGRGKSGQNASGWYFDAEYFVLADQPADSQVRDNAAWRAWAMQHAEANDA
jgi:hypothetical protein